MGWRLHRFWIFPVTWQCVECNGQYTIDEVTDHVITLRARPIVDDTDTVGVDESSPDESLASESGTGVTISGPDTIRRNAGSWIADGFQAGDSLHIAGTVHNDRIFTAASVTRGVIYLENSDTLVDETAENVGISSDPATAPGSFSGADVVAQAMSGEQIISFSWLLETEAI